MDKEISKIIKLSLKGYVLKRESLSEDKKVRCISLIDSVPDGEIIKIMNEKIIRESIESNVRALLRARGTYRDLETVKKKMLQYGVGPVLAVLIRLFLMDKGLLRILGVTGGFWYNWLLATVIATLAMAVTYWYRRGTDICREKSEGDIIKRYECNIAGAEKIINELNMRIGECNKIEDVEQMFKCKATISKQVKRLQNKIAKYIEKINSIKIKTAAKETARGETPKEEEPEKPSIFG